jgi:hypothetical protein
VEELLILKMLGISGTLLEIFSDKRVYSKSFFFSVFEFLIRMKSAFQNFLERKIQ